jgi:hypothetical protein
MTIDLHYSFTKEIITKTVRLRLLSNGIIHYTYLPNSEVDETEHQINHNALFELIEKGKKNLLLIDSDEFINITPEARKLIRKLEPLIPITARAVIIKTLGQRILANFYIKFHKPIIPTKIFNNHEEAILYLNTIDVDFFIKQD